MATGKFNVDLPSEDQNPLVLLASICKLWSRGLYNGKEMSTEEKQSAAAQVIHNYRKVVVGNFSAINHMRRVVVGDQKTRQYYLDNHGLTEEDLAVFESFCKEMLITERHIVEKIGFDFLYDNSCRVVLGKDDKERDEGIQNLTFFMDLCFRAASATARPDALHFEVETHAMARFKGILKEAVFPKPQLKEDGSVKREPLKEVPEEKLSTLAHQVHAAWSSTKATLTPSASSEGFVKDMMAYIEPHSAYEKVESERDGIIDEVAGWHDDVRKLEWFAKDRDIGETVWVWTRKVLSIPGRAVIWLFRQFRRLYDWATNNNQGTSPRPANTDIELDLYKVPAMATAAAV